MIETESWHLFYRHIPPAWYNSVPSARHNHAGVVHAGFLYIYGGMCNLEERGDFWKFDLGWFLLLYNFLEQYTN